VYILNKNTSFPPRISVYLLGGGEVTEMLRLKSWLKMKRNVLLIKVKIIVQYNVREEQKFYTKIWTEGVFCEKKVKKDRFKRITIFRGPPIKSVHSVSALAIIQVQ
jgi:hypothetical protein